MHVICASAWRGKMWQIGELFKAGCIYRSVPWTLRYLFSTKAYVINQRNVSLYNEHCILAQNRTGWQRISFGANKAANKTSEKGQSGETPHGGSDSDIDEFKKFRLPQDIGNPSKRYVSKDYGVSNVFGKETEDETLPRYHIFAKDAGVIYVKCANTSARWQQAFGLWRMER